MSIKVTRARIAELSGQASWLKAQRAQALDEHSRGIGGAADRVAAHGNALTALTAELDLEHEVLAHLGEQAQRDTEVSRRADARKAAADAVQLLRKNEQSAAKVDKAFDALIDAMRDHVAAATLAADTCKRAVKLAVPNLAARSSSAITFGSATGGMFSVAAASALRDLFSGLDSPQHVFEPAPGLTLPVGERLPFADAAEWLTRAMSSNTQMTVETAVKAEEALVADLQRRGDIA